MENHYSVHSLICARANTYYIYIVMDFYCDDGYMDIYS